MSLKRILFMGMPGAGKSTQARLLINPPYSLKHISTGDLIREAVKREDSLVMPYKDHMDAGGYLPDPETFELITKELKDLDQWKGYVFDGAIRTIPQAKFALRGNLVDKVLLFNLREEEIIRRLTKRYETGKRPDDALDVVLKRIKKYKKETEPVIDYLTGKGIPIYMMNASPSVGEIHQRVLRILDLEK